MINKSAEEVKSSIKRKNTIKRSRILPRLLLSESSEDSSKLIEASIQERINQNLDSNRDKLKFSRMPSIYLLQNSDSSMQEED